MSSVASISAPTVIAGTDLVDSLALDAQVELIVDRINQVIAAMGEARTATNSLADGAVRWRAFSTRAKQILSDLVDHLATLYRAYSTRWTDLPVADGGGYVSVGGGFFSGYSADPSTNTWVYTMPGEAPAPFLLRLLIRHFAAATPTATATITLSGSRSESWVLNPAPGAAVERTLTIIVQAGDVLTINFIPGDEFTGDTDFPTDRDRFPYRPRYRACGAFQFDWLSYMPLTPLTLATADGDGITTSDDADIGVEFP